MGISVQRSRSSQDIRDFPLPPTLLGQRVAHASGGAGNQRGVVRTESISLGMLIEAGATGIFKIPAEHEIDAALA